MFECGADYRWEPPKELKSFIVIKPRGHESKRYISVSQIVRLLSFVNESRDTKEGRKWWNAIALVSYFGVRGVELGWISANGVFLHCSYSKRTTKQPKGTPPRDIISLDPDGLEGKGDELICLLKEKCQG